MPKVTLTEAQRVRERLRNNLDLIQGKRDCGEMAKVIGRSYGTYRNRLADPESLTLREVRMLCNKFGVDIAKFVSDEIKLG